MSPDELNRLGRELPGPLNPESDRPFSIRVEVFGVPRDPLERLDRLGIERWLGRERVRHLQQESESLAGLPLAIHQRRHRRRFGLRRGGSGKFGQSGLSMFFGEVSGPERPLLLLPPPPRPR